MADEIAQLTQIQIEGVKLVVKGGVEVSQFVLRLLRALFTVGKEGVGLVSDTVFMMPGGKRTLAEINRISDGPSQGLDIRTEDVEEVLKIAKEKGLHYWRAVDYDPNDGFTPIQYPAQEASAWGQIYKAVSARRLAADKENLSTQDMSIAELREKLLNAEHGSEQAKACEVQLENMIQAREEAQKWVESGENLQNTPDEKVSYSLQDYLRKFKGTDFEINPEIAMAEYEKGVEPGVKITAKECFQPVRDKSLMPESRLTFYVPDIGVIVTREFVLDDRTDLVYSNYFLKSPNGERFTFSDHNMTKADWNEQVLPDLMTKAGVLEGTMCRAFNNEEKLKLYLAYHNKVENPAKQRIEERLREGKEVFSSAETRSEILHAMSEQDKGFASAKIADNKLEIICTPERFTNRGGKLDFKLSDDEHLQFSSVDVTADLAGNGQFKLTISDQSKPVFVKTVGEAQTTIPIALAEAKRRMDEAYGRTADVLSEAVSHTKKSGR